MKDYAIYHASLNEPIKPPNLDIWIMNNGSSSAIAVEADDINISENGFEIGGITYDGSDWDYSNAGQGSGGGSGGGSGEAFIINLLAVDPDGYAEIVESYQDILSAVEQNLPIFINYSVPNETHPLAQVLNLPCSYNNSDGYINCYFNYINSIPTGTLYSYILTVASNELNLD